MKHATTDPIVQEFGLRVRRVLGPKLTGIYWFGSRARGEGVEDSDYDLLVETSERLSPEERDRVVRVSVDISGKQGVVMDVHYSTWQKLHGPHRVGTPFREAVLGEGVPV